MLFRSVAPPPDVYKINVDGATAGVGVGPLWE